MKRIFVLCMTAGMFAGTVSAQVRERPRNECLKACSEVETPFKGLAPLERKLAELRERKQRETNPHQLERLTEDEQELIEEHKDRRQHICHQICDGNPES